MSNIQEQARLLKNEKIRAAQKETKARRATQVCSVYKVKIDESNLSKRQKEHLKMLFVEAKWVYNDILNFSKDNNLKDYKTSKKNIIVKNKNGEFEERELKYIGSQMKQSILTGVIASIKTLSTLKKKGYQKPGNLRYISNYTSLSLKQFGNTYKIDSKNKMRIQGVPGRVRVNGLDQIIFDSNIEYANAKILNTPRGYYIAITTFKNKGGETEDNKSLPEIGIDFGIKTSITTSEGEKISVLIEETERLKRLQKRLSRQKKGSNNRYKSRKLLQKEYQKITNMKIDTANKIAAKLLEHEKIYMQDEQIRDWHKRKFFSKKVYHSILGRVKAKLSKSNRVIILDKMVPTTKYCPVCKSNNDISLKDRVYHCICGYTKDRDIHSACNMIILTKEGYSIKNDKSKAAKNKQL